MNKYKSGTRVRSIANFKDFDGNLADPTTIEFKYRSGAGATQTITNATKDGTGVYHFDIDTSGWAGPDDLLYTCQWKGTGNVQALDDDYFEVEPATL